MTSPQPTEPPVEEPTVAEQLFVLYIHIKEAELLEDAAAVATTYALHKRILAVITWAAIRWIRDHGALTATADPEKLARFIPELRHRLASARTNPHDDLLTWARKAFRLGVKQGTAEAGFPVSVPDLLGIDTRTAALKAQLNVEDRFRRADRVLAVTQGDTHADIMQGIAIARGAVGDTERSARWITNRELNHGTAQVAGRLDAGLLWMAERDACVHCLAYSGVIAEPRQNFPPGLTFGERPLKPWPDGILERPPLHPHCRCRVTPWLGASADGPGVVALPEALKREARRSILKGWSLESEPESVRLQAADRLLAVGANLPKTVEERARRAVRLGRFASRTVPTG